MTTKIREHTCEACQGTGYPVVMQPVQANRKIYPAKCKACDGKGKITDANDTKGWTTGKTLHDKQR